MVLRNIPSVIRMVVTPLSRGLITIASTASGVIARSNGKVAKLADATSQKELKMEKQEKQLSESEIKSIIKHEIVKHLTIKQNHPGGNLFQVKYAGYKVCDFVINIKE